MGFSALDVLLENVYPKIVGLYDFGRMVMEAKTMSVCCSNFLNLRSSQTLPPYINWLQLQRESLILKLIST